MMDKLVKYFRNGFSDRLIFLSFPLGITAAVFLNQLITLTGIKEIFTAYSERVQSQMFLYPLFTGIVLYGIITPVVEEIAFRQILFGRLKIYMATGAAAIFSSIIFGIYHGNFIQFIYACIFGLMLSFLYWRFNCVFASIFAHSAANIFVYINASTGGIKYLSTVSGELISVVISGILTFAMLKKVYDSRPKKRHIIKKLPIFPQRWE